MPKKTPKMIRIEEQLGRPLEEDINPNQDSPEDVASRWGVPVNTFYIWMYRLGYTTKTVVVSQNGKPKRTRKRA